MTEPLEHLFGDLLRDDESARAVWQRFHEELSAHHEAFAQQLGRHLEGEELLHMLALLLTPIARNGFKDGPTKVGLFHIAQALGIHLLPVHYFSPVPNTFELREEVFTNSLDSLGGCHIDVAAQLDLIERIAPWATETADIPSDKSGSAQFYWNNLSFGPLDALVYYGMVREFRPSRIIEVGGGFSTLLASRAARANGTTRVLCIEPHPSKLLREGLGDRDRLLALPVQEVPLEEFDRLGPGDILFVDSTHVSKIDSDVNFLLFQVLPRLREGVLVHFHDIFLPDEYPRSWIERGVFFNEQYLLRAFLLFNESFEVLLMNHYLAGAHGEKLEQAFHRAFPSPPAVEPASFWMRRRLPGGLGGPHR